MIAVIACVALVVFTISGSLIVHAVPVPGLNLDSLSKDSTLIVTGEVTSIRDAGLATVSHGDLQLEAEMYTGSIRPDQILKGTVSENRIAFRSYVPNENIGWQRVSQGYGLFFLKNGPSVDMEFTNPYYPFLPTTPGADVPNGSVIERILFALRNRLASPTATVNQKVVTIFFLTCTRSPAAIAALHEAYADPLREVQLAAAGALLERNDTTGLEVVKEALLQRPQSISPVMSHNLAYAVSSGLTDSKAVPVVTQLIASPDPEVRRAAASSLMHMESPDAIEPLKSLLDDSDFEARYDAVVGLAQIAKQADWHPGMEQFRANERKYLEHWRNWAPTH